MRDEKKVCTEVFKSRFGPRSYYKPVLYEAVPNMLLKIRKYFCVLIGRRQKNDFKTSNTQS